MSNRTIIIVGAIVVAVVVVTMIVLPLSGRHAQKTSGPTASNGGPQTAAAVPSAQATAASAPAGDATAQVLAPPPPDTGAPLTVEQMAEMCVDAELLNLTFQGGPTKLQYWVPAHFATLPCSEAMKWALCQWALYGAALGSGDPKLVGVVNEALASGIGETLKVMSDTLARDPAHAVGGVVLIANTGDLGKSGIESAAEWLKTCDAKDDALIAQQAKSVAPLIADAKFQKLRADLIQAETKALQEDTKTCKELGEALKVAPELVKPRQELCQRLEAASAQVK